MDRTRTYPSHDGYRMAARRVRLSEDFSGLMLRFRGRTGLSQRALAERLGAHVRSVQLWEAGASHPTAQRLQALTEVLLGASGFAAGAEQSEAEALWATAMAESSRLKAPFDAARFARLLADRTARPSPTAGHMQLARVGAVRQQWGDAPDPAALSGRVTQLATLRRWVLDDASRLVAVLGLGGVGKTLLASRVAHDLAPAFDAVHWRSLRNAPTAAEWLADVVGFLSPPDAAPGRVSDASANVGVERLLDLLRQTRCLLILDNVETVLEPGDRVGGYRAGYAAYGELLQQVAQSPHQSCLLLTSREQPPGLRPLRSGLGEVQRLTLDGLGVAESQALLSDHALAGDEAAWQALVSRYSGNALALRIIGHSIHELFGGDVGAFLADVERGQDGLFGGVRQLLETQVRRLSDLELDALHWLAVEREPLTFAELADALQVMAGRGAAREAVEALRRRSLLERQEPGPVFMLPSIVLDYVTEHLVDALAQEVAARRPPAPGVPVCRRIPHRKDHAPWSRRASHLH